MTGRELGVHATRVRPDLKVIYIIGYSSNGAPATGDSIWTRACCEKRSRKTSWPREFGALLKRRNAGAVRRTSDATRVVRRRRDAAPGAPRTEMRRLAEMGPGCGRRSFATGCKPADRCDPLSASEGTNRRGRT